MEPIFAGTNVSSPALLEPKAATKVPLTLAEAITEGNLKMTQAFVKEGDELQDNQSPLDLATDPAIKNYFSEKNFRAQKMDSILNNRFADLELQLPEDPSQLKRLLSAALCQNHIISQRSKSQFNTIASIQSNTISELKNQIQELQDLAAEQQTFFSQLVDEEKDTPKSKKGSDDIILIKNESGQMVVKSGTIEKLVERLLDPMVHDNHFTQTLLLNHKSVCESHVLLDWIAGNFKLNTKETLPKLLKSINTVKYWVEQFWTDFQSDEYLMQKLTTHVASIENAKLAQTLRNLLIKKTNQAAATEAPIEAITDAPKPILLKQLTGKRSSANSSLRPPGSSYTRDTAGGLPSYSEEGGKLKLSDLDPVEVARQLTLIEFDFFAKVKPREFTGLAWMKDDKETRAPNITKMVRWSNHVIKWLVTEIVNIKDNLKLRVMMMEKVIMIAKACDSLHNFNAVKEIMAALQSSAVGRLKKTKEALSPKHVKILEELSELTKQEHNFKHLRAKTHAVDPPLIPFPGVYQGDLVFLESYGKDLLQGGMVNFIKFQKVTQYVVELQVYQQALFKLSPIPEIQDMIKDFIGLEEEPAYACSLICEPRGS